MLMEIDNYPSRKNNCLSASLKDVDKLIQLDRNPLLLFGRGAFVHAYKLSESALQLSRLLYSLTASGALSTVIFILSVHPQPHSACFLVIQRNKQKKRRKKTQFCF